MFIVKTMTSSPTMDIPRTAIDFSKTRINFFMFDAREGFTFTRASLTTIISATFELLVQQ